jgi:S-methylmethionine-dependent homocysteine/selenocysteine methylase
MLRLLDEGADALGGCCGAGPLHVAALAHALDERFPPTR